VKLEVIGDERTLFPDNEALNRSDARVPWSAKGSWCCLTTSDDPRRLPQSSRNAGRGGDHAAGRAPIGSGLGIQNVNNLRIIREFGPRCPLVVDAGVGTASDASAGHGARRRRGCS